MVLASPAFLKASIEVWTAYITKGWIWAGPMSTWVHVHRYLDTRVNIKHCRTKLWSVSTFSEERHRCENFKRDRAVPLGNLTRVTELL